MTEPTESHAALSVAADGEPAIAPRRRHLLLTSLLLLLAAIAVALAGGFGWMTGQCRDLGLAAGWTALFAVLGVGGALENAPFALLGLAAWVGLIAVLRNRVTWRVTGTQVWIAALLLYLLAATVAWFAMPADTCRIHF
ncbi:hypothetical protein [Burkholderia sp. Ac-20379]|uniref:hypothetical protein n=1 Tax=Burkholderia sp. Ac-20379 TaxID=2703900 RepID=UPI001981AAA8|nr:hypothetical protein [Burkholderia sp. Ac-20379]MBN3726673.1 hypothetical protein [Burkholderia sp. Ac-20379]